MIMNMGRRIKATKGRVIPMLVWPGLPALLPPLLLLVVEGLNWPNAVGVIAEKAWQPNKA